MQKLTNTIIRIVVKNNIKNLFKKFSINRENNQNHAIILKVNMRFEDFIYKKLYSLLKVEIFSLNSSNGNYAWASCVLCGFKPMTFNLFIFK